MTGGSSTTGVRTSHRPRRGDWLFSVALLATFTVGHLAAETWPFRAALFPQLVSAAGFLLTALKLVGLTMQAVRSKRPQPLDEADNDSAQDHKLVDEEAEEAESIEYVFATAGRRAWAGALAWIVVFFVLLWLLGVFVTVPIFALLYLKVAGKASWVSSALYAIVLGGVIYLAFRQLLFVPMPAGVF